MTWCWRYETQDGTQAHPEDTPTDPFPTQADAETWLGENWRRLREHGVDQAVLFDGEDKVYGPMSLHPGE